jgi:molybdate transport system substrate-binding protein
MRSSDDDGRAAAFRTGEGKPRDGDGPRPQHGGRAASNAAQSDTALYVLSAGAAQGIVRATQSAFSNATGAEVRESFGAVGAIKAKLIAGEPCDVVILTAALIDELIYGGQVRAGTAVALGRVKTGVAVRVGAPAPQVATAAMLRQTLEAASAIYVPDTQQSTAGRHVAGMLSTLNIGDELAGRLRVFANGAAAMRALAVEGDVRAIGITQVTEIMYTEGVSLAGLLPPEFELATLYSAAISRGARHPAAAGELIAMLTGDAARALRVQAGFER